VDVPRVLGKVAIIVGAVVCVMATGAIGPMSLTPSIHPNRLAFRKIVMSEL